MPLEEFWLALNMIPDPVVILGYICIDSGKPTLVAPLNAPGNDSAKKRFTHTLALTRQWPPRILLTSVPFPSTTNHTLSYRHVHRFKQLMAMCSILEANLCHLQNICTLPSFVYVSPTAHLRRSCVQKKL